MATARPQFKRLLAAVAVVASLSAASAATETIEAKFKGIGKDYFAAKMAITECQCKPTNPDIDPFNVGCTRKDIWDYSNIDTPFNVELERRPIMDLPPAQAELEASLNIVRPARHFVGGDGGRRARKTVASLNGPRSNLIIRLNMGDVVVGHTTEAQARLMMQSPSPGDKDVNGLFQAMSYGGMSFPAENTTVVTVTSPNTSAAYADGCDAYAFADHALELLRVQHSGIDHTTFQHKSFLIPEALGNCMWTGSAVPGCRSNTGCHAWLREGSASVLAHQLAHNLGLAHSGVDENDDGVQEGHYGDAGCLMGKASHWSSVNAPHREVLGHLGDGGGGDGNGAATYDMACALHATAQVTLTISRLDLSPVGNPHPNVVRIARHQDHPPSTVAEVSNYLLSFKSSADWDGGSSDEYRNRLQIHTHAGPGSSAPDETLLIKHLGEGDVFVGRANRSGSPVPLNVRVVSIGTDAITVTVNTGCGENLRGYTACDLAVGNVTEPGAEDDVGGAGVSHVWHFTLDRQMAVTFDDCASSVNTTISAISVFNRLSVDDAGAYSASLDTADALAHADEGCTAAGGPPISLNLDAGNYSVVLARPGGNDQGVYSMTMQCPSANFRGRMGCEQTVSGDTNDPGINLVTSASVIEGGDGAPLKDSVDHVWHFTLDRSMKVTLDACASSFDTNLGVLGRLEMGSDGEVIPAALYAFNDDGCAALGRSRIADQTLSAGDYSVVIEGYGAGDSGVYSVTMACVDATTTPTRPPTSPPTRPPTVIGDHCPAGYRNYPTRYNQGLGRIVIVAAHEECAARCTTYSGRQWRGGCRGYMTGMYFGYLYCRSYGSVSHTTACAPWAAPGQVGLRSGTIGSIHPRTGQRNVGGQCCSNANWRECGDPEVNCEATGPGPSPSPVANVMFGNGDTPVTPSPTN